MPLGVNLRKPLMSRNEMENIMTFTQLIIDSTAVDKYPRIDRDSTAGLLLICEIVSIDLLRTAIIGS